MNVMNQSLSFTVNGAPVSVHSSPVTRLVEVLRLELGLTGTKVGCNAGDCGACTVLLDGRQVCACMVPVGQVQGRDVQTVEGLGADGALSTLQQAFHKHGAAQCGICTPGMLMAARELLDSTPVPTEQQAMDALGGVLCRCTGYRKIVDAVLDVAATLDETTPDAGAAVGAPLLKIDGKPKLTGEESFGADAAPADSLWCRVVRAPHGRANFTVGDLEAFKAGHPGLEAVISNKDLPGAKLHGVYPVGKDTPVLATGFTRHKGEGVLVLVGDKLTVESIRDDDLPIDWSPLEPVYGVEAALAEGAPLVQDDKPGNILTGGFLQKGDVDAALAAADHVAEGSWQTSFVEHAYIEPEAGWAQRVGDRMEMHVTTQAPYMNRDEVAAILGIAKEDVRIVPTAVGGGFGGKLDMSVHVPLALAAWSLDRPVRITLERPESMASSTKRHPARMTATAGCSSDGKLTALRFDGDFDTGAYSSWGPTVADRVPVHATGPYIVPNVRNRTQAVLTNAPPAGAFRGFGVPQASITSEALYDELAEKCGLDPLEFRLLNVIRHGGETATGQILEHSVGMAECLEVMKPAWVERRAAATAFNENSAVLKRGVGISCMWYGCGNTGIPNPSTMKVGISAEGKVTLYNGVMDIGQGPNTIMPQICADAIGIPVNIIGQIHGDTDLTADAGKSSASRQTFVSGRATQLAGEDLRTQILRLANVGDDARIEIVPGEIVVRDGDAQRTIDLRGMATDPNGDVLLGTGTFDPPTVALDENGQGIPYATYGFGAQIAEVEVDTELGTVKVLKIWAAYDVGRAVNPMQLDGQIHGGVAQGLGLALMEEYIPERTENLHDYLIPTVGDVPPIETFLIEDPEPLGPFGAKGIGEQSLIPTPAAIFGAIHHATGARMRHAPATPARVRAAILATRQG